ncbi:MAG: hypothetical protein P1U77_24025 [Rubripirellula sp.]|nr:hypothetical protein [Rubripirellula sp.]
MKLALRPWQLMLIILAGWINRQQQEVIEYPRTENAVLEEMLGKKRILLTDDQRCRLAVKFAKENPTWGDDRIGGALSNVGCHICDSTIGNILKVHGIEPAPVRKYTVSWETFLKAHLDVMAAIDSTTVEVWTKVGLTTFYLLFVMELKTRRVKFVGCTANPNEAWLNGSP